MISPEGIFKPKFEICLNVPVKLMYHHSPTDPSASSSAFLKCLVCTLRCVCMCVCVWCRVSERKDKRRLSARLAGCSADWCGRKRSNSGCGGAAHPWKTKQMIGPVFWRTNKQWVRLTYFVCVSVCTRRTLPPLSYWKVMNYVPSGTQQQPGFFFFLVIHIWFVT